MHMGTQPSQVLVLPPLGGWNLGQAGFVVLMYLRVGLPEHQERGIRMG